MAKSKKKKNQDFQKVKLKVGKKLKKADNVTNTSFKTRAIQISQQLKTGESSQPSTKKKQNIKELFTHCRHYSSSVRLEAVNGMRELITCNPELLSSNLSDILERAAELLIDKESTVRQASVRLFKIFLPMMTEKQISPFFPLLCAHLSCAMTHIADHIQEDSLSVLDLILETFPKLMVTKSSQVLPNFIEQISRRQGQGKAKRSLSTNPDSSTSSVKWRISVLNRLHKFLNAMLQYGTQLSDSGDIRSCVIDNLSSIDNFAYPMERQLFVQPFPTSTRSAWTMPGFILGSGFTQEKTTRGDVLDGQLAEYTDTLIPLLLECWVECAPSKHGRHDSGNLISGENVQMMYSVLQVTQLLWKCIHSLHQDEDEGPLNRNKYLKDFQQHFLSNFPYSVNPTSGKLNKKTSANIQVSAEMLNLTICDIMTYFIGEDNMSYDYTWLPLVTQYLNDFIGGVYGRGGIGQSSRTFVNTVERLISRGVLDNTMLSIIVEIFNRYESANLSSSEKTVYLQFFAEKMVANGELSSLSPDLRRKFLRTLPGLLPLSKDNPTMCSLLIDTMKKAACQRCADMIDKTFLSTVRQQWFDPSAGVLLNLSAHYQRELVSLLYHIPNIDISLLKTLVDLVRCEQLGESLVKYLIQVLHERYMKYWNRVDNAALHISFLTNLILGMSMSEIEDILSNTSTRQTSVLGDFTIVEPSDSDDFCLPGFDRHYFILESVCGIVKQFHNTDQVVQVIFEQFQNLLLKNQRVPLKLAFGICKFTESLTSIPIAYESLANRLSLSLVSYLVTCYSSTNQDSVKKMKDICCNLVSKSTIGFDHLLEAACLDTGKALDVEKLATVLKTVMLFLSEGRHTCIQGHTERLQSLLSLQTSLQQFTKDNKGQITNEVESLLVNLNYMLSSIQ